MSYQSENVRPYNSPESKKKQVQHMFDEIAPTYDKLNRFMSLGIDNSWRRDAIQKLEPLHPESILDIATGTGDFAILAQKILRPQSIVGIDISDKMMAIGEQKVERLGLSGIIRFENQDCTALTFPENHFDAATVAFGVRNFEDIDAGFTEIRRVLKPGGRFVFLELTTPERFPMKQLYGIYSKYLIPFMGRLMSTDKQAYEYLPASIKAFPQGDRMVKTLEKNGFVNVRLKRYTGGVCTLYIAEK